ncbi:MAG: DUF6473 family protein [Pararhodobacter sp.]
MMKQLHCNSRTLPQAVLARGVAMPLAAPRHEGLVLLGPRGGALLHGAPLLQLAQRLVSPAARIEGIDRHLNDACLALSAWQARAFVLRLPPPGNQQNPFYRVHPKRNDRFLRAEPLLKALFPEVDFAAFDFTGHMLGTLHATCPERFSRLRAGLAASWLEKMRNLLARMPSRGVLLQPPAPDWLTTSGAGLEQVDLPRLVLADETAPALAARLGPVLRPLLQGQI